MDRRRLIPAGILAVVVLAGTCWLWGQTKKPITPALNTAAISQKIVQYIRERFNFPATVKLSTGTFRNSPFADFYVTTVTVDEDRKSTRLNSSHTR